MRSIMNLFCFFKKEAIPLISNVSNVSNNTIYITKKVDCRECKREIRIEDTIYFCMDRKFCSKECRRDFIIKNV